MWRRRVPCLAMLLVIFPAVLASCGGSTPAPPTGAFGQPTSPTGTVALLLPETKTTRYETADRPYFEVKFKQLYPTCEVIYSNANQDAVSQQQQAEAAITNRARVLVLDPVDSAAAAAIASKAKSRECRSSRMTGSS